jgi:histidinol phosphatase-like enzyme
MSMILAIDFDGTIVEDEYPKIGKLRPNAKKFINKLSKEGYFIIIWTCRTQEYGFEAEQFLIENGIKFDEINKSCPANVEAFIGNDTRKVFANLYIDDKGLITIPDWETIYNIVHEKVPTYGDKVARDGFL